MRAMPIPALQDEGLLFLWLTGQGFSSYGWQVRASLLMADRSCNGSRTCMSPRLGLHSCRWSCVGKDQSGSTCNTHRTYCSLAQPYKGTHACRRQVTTLLSKWLWISAQVSQLWCRYGRRRQWSEGDVDEVYGLIERMCPGGRKTEIFGRHNIRPGWLTLGGLWTGFARKIYWKEYRLSEYPSSLSCHDKSYFDQVSREEDHCRM